MNDFTAEKLKLVFMLSLSVMFILIIAIAGFIVRTEKKNDKKQEEYNLETYHDEDTGITMVIFKDKLGDVVYCEPIHADIERNR